MSISNYIRTRDVRPRTVARFGYLVLALWLFAAAELVAGITTAHADPEVDYTITFGPTAVCPVLDQYPTPAGVFGVIHGIMVDGFTDEAAVRIINASVYTFCRRHWPLLVAMGRVARGEQGQTA